MGTFVHGKFWYDFARKWFTIIPPFISALLFFINAPFGRFSPSRNSIFLVDGIKSWIAMELVSPLCFTYALLSSPFPPSPSLSRPQIVLSLLYYLHYLNRAVVSPLRTPSRSQSHIIVPLCAIAFNIINGALMGAYIASPTAHAFISFDKPIFYFGIVLWGLGFAGNVIHDEVLLNIRRKAKAKGKGKEVTQADGDSGPKREYYAIPHGFLYEYVSYPNYLCEWVEWLGFALAAGPIPYTAPFSGILSSIPGLIVSIPHLLMSPPHLFFPTLSPPYVFFLTEILLMIPRAYRGHRWYQEKFPQYPVQRRVAIPFLF